MVEGLDTNFQDKRANLDKVFHSLCSRFTLCAYTDDASASAKAKQHIDNLAKTKLIILQVIGRRDGGGLPQTKTQRDGE